MGFFTDLLNRLKQKQAVRDTVDYFGIGQKGSGQFGRNISNVVRPVVKIATQQIQSNAQPRISAVRNAYQNSPINRDIVQPIKKVWDSGVTIKTNPNHKPADFAIQNFLNKHIPDAPVTKVVNAYESGQMKVPSIKNALKQDNATFKQNLADPAKSQKLAMDMTMAFSGGTGEVSSFNNAVKRIANTKNAAFVKDIAKKAGLNISKAGKSFWKELASEADPQKVSDMLSLIRNNAQKAVARKIAIQGTKDVVAETGQRIKNTVADGLDALRQVSEKSNIPLLQSGKKIATTKSEAKRLFKQGKLEDVKIKLKTNEKPLIFSANDGETKFIKVSERGGEREIPVKINALNDVDPEGIKDITGLDASFKSIYRNFQKAFGEKFADVKRRILDPFDSAKGNMIREQEALATDLKKNVADGLGIRKGSKESAAVQQFGEKNRDFNSLVKEFGEEKANKIVQADKWFRAQYNRLLDEVNATRAKIYPNNPDKQIPRRQDYYRHFQELTGLEGLKNTFDSPANIPTELAGVSDNTVPKSKFLSFAQKRLGLKTKEDAVGGFLDYMRSATYAKHIDPHIEKFRNLAGEIKNMAGQGDERLGSRFTEYLEDFANDLSGKTNALDRSAQKILGRKTFKVINWLNSRVKANVILGNLSSAVAQAGNTPQMMAKAGYKNWMGGFKDTLLHSNKNMAKSDWLNERYAHSIFDQFDTKLADQPKKLAVWITGALDELATKIGWNGYYRQAIQKGVANPVKYADDLARASVGGRGVGEVPLIQKSKVVQLVAPFQLEVQNLMQELGGQVKNKEFGTLLKYVLAAYAFNKTAEAIRGSGVTFDPLQASIDAYKAYQEEEDKKVGALRAGGRLTGEVLSNVMFGQTAASFYPKNGIKVGGETVTRKELFGKEDPTRFGTGILGSAIQDPLYKILPPFGGSQIKKTIEGGKTYSQGYSTDNGGNVQFPVDKTPVNLAKSLAFGKYATGQAREYFDKGRSTLKDTQNEIFKAYGNGKDYYNNIIATREAEAQSKKQIEAAKAGKTVKTTTTATVPTQSGIVSLSNGKFYSKELDDSFTTEQDAIIAVNKDKFKKSGKNFQVIDGMVYRLNKGGEVQPLETEVSYNTKLTTQKLENAKTAKNLNEWMKLAETQANNLQQQLADPTLDELDKMELQQKYDKLISDAQKYASYGGFTKGKKPIMPDASRVIRLSAPQAQAKSSGVTVAKIKMPNLSTSMPKISVGGFNARAARRPKARIRIAR